MPKKIKRFGVSIESDLITKFDKFIKKEGYTNRSEAIRNLIRNYIITEKSKNPEEKVFGTLTIIYDYNKGLLTNKLLNVQHEHHSEIISTTHIHLDHYNCLEVLVLKGKIGRIEKLEDNIHSLKGIKNGELVITKSSI